MLKPSGKIVPDQCAATLDSATTTTGNTNSQKHSNAANAMKAPAATRVRKLRCTGRARLCMTGKTVGSSSTAITVLLLPCGG